MFSKLANPPFELRTVIEFGFVFKRRMIKKPFNKVTKSMFFSCILIEVLAVSYGSLNTLSPNFCFSQTFERSTLNSSTFDPNLNLITRTIFPISFSDTCNISIWLNLDKLHSHKKLQNNAKLDNMIINLILFNNLSIIYSYLC